MKTFLRNLSSQTALQFKKEGGPSESISPSRKLQDIISSSIIPYTIGQNENEKRKNSKRARHRSLMHMKPGRHFKSIEVWPEPNV